MIKFEKVSYEQFKKDYIKIFGDEVSETDIKEFYDNLKLPTRSTACSAGYDFYAPFSMSLDSMTEITIPTGVRVTMDSDKALLLMPRSGLGMKHYMRLSNTLGLVDARL
jgi:dUTP pyrophosphatase